MAGSPGKLVAIEDGHLNSYPISVKEPCFSGVQTDTEAVFIATQNKVMSGVFDGVTY
jgi:hypothetical protein